METLPFEMVEKVSRHLTTRDLARCCAVSHKWREIFDQDRLWKTHCDLELEEPLRTTPSVVKPVFVSPEGEYSTLTTISKWRLAFLRERHLCGNWTKKNYETQSFGSDINFFELFLSNNLLLLWTERMIQIWDVSVVPAFLVAEIDSPVNFDELCEFSVVNSNTFVVEKWNCIQVFQVDIINKSIKMKHQITPDENRSFGITNFETKQLTSVDGSVILGISVSDLKLEILDLEKGMKIMEVPCPETEDDAHIYHIETSPTNDDLLVSVRRDTTVDHYIYSLQQKLFLPGPIASTSLTYNIAINKHFVAFGNLPSMRILDYHTSEVVFENKDQETDLYPQAYKDSFVFLEEKSEHCWLKLFSLSYKTISTVLEFSPPIQCNLKIVNNKFVCVYGRINNIKSEDTADSWDKYLNLIIFEDSGEAPKPAPTFLEDRNINKACTRGFSSYWTNSALYYFW